MDKYSKYRNSSRRMMLGRTNHPSNKRRGKAWAKAKQHLYDVIAQTWTNRSSPSLHRNRNHESRSSTVGRCSPYQVFLSFRGKDTRTSFTDHLYTALKHAGIRAFKDDDGVERGESIKAGLGRAIQQSRASIIVLSKNFASSRWCLDELVMMLERKRTVGHVVLPVFYHVRPSQVRNQSGTFAHAFARHEARFDDNDRVEGWREALRKVADLKGMVLQKNQGESQFIQEIVEEIEKTLKRTTMNPLPHPVGMDPRTKKINLSLQDESDEVGISTTYGIGKTGIAKTVYGLNLERFRARIRPFIKSTALDVMVAEILLRTENVKFAAKRFEARDKLLTKIIALEEKDTSKMTEDQIRRHNDLKQKLWTVCCSDNE